MGEEILQRQQQAALDNDLVALISVSADNVGYTAGYMVPSQVIPIRKRVFACVVGAGGQRGMLVANVEENEARARSRIKDIRPYNEFTEDPMQVLASILREFGLDRGRIGIELDALPAMHYHSLRQQLPKATFVNAEPVFDRLRMVKTSEEIEHLRTVARAVQSAHERAYASVTTGATEKELAKVIMDVALEEGADEVAKIVIGSGERSVFANCSPTDRALNPGDIVRVDVFCLRNGYWSDIARTAVVGEVAQEQADIWAKLVEAENLVLGQIRPEASTGAIFRSYLRKFEEMGLEPAINFVGHGLGLTLHEGPYIDRYSDTLLEAGMVLCIEPVYNVGQMGFHLEDEVLVTESGYEMLSDGRNGGTLRCIR